MYWIIIHTEEEGFKAYPAETAEDIDEIKEIALAGRENSKYWITKET